MKPKIRAVVGDVTPGRSTPAPEAGAVNTAINAESGPPGKTRAARAVKKFLLRYVAASAVVVNRREIVNKSPQLVSPRDRRGLVLRFRSIQKVLAQRRLNHRRKQATECDSK